ncbi:major capsid protein [Agrobacterium sp. SHOUNA12C]|nr:major capsid protein [Agrobacterium sp. BETTINA12B]MCJ9757014.1 major capsid protein [Agrobacterium sp. SHOUNA12C]
MSDQLTAIFTGEAFSLGELTASINKVDQAPYMFRQLLDINEESVTTTAAGVEEKNGRISVIQSSARGSEAKVSSDPKRKVRYFEIPHYVESASIQASEVQNVRAFGETNLLQTVEAKRDEKNAILRAKHEVTAEFAVAGMVAGKLLDSDGSIIQDWHAPDGFNIARSIFDLDITDATLDLRAEFLKIKRALNLRLGGFLVKGFNVFFAAEMFDDFIKHPSITKMYERFQEGVMFRNDPSAGSVVLADNMKVFCYEPNQLNGLNFIPTDTGFVVPDAPGLLQGRFAPADTLETANTPGIPFYAIPGEVTARKVSWDTESNPLYFCIDPAAIGNITFA